MTIATENRLPTGVRHVRTLAGVDEYQLDNGLQILLNVDATIAAPVHVDLVYRVGSKHESFSELGMAHVLEHMVFKLSDCDACNAMQELMKRTVRYTAETHFDYTRYNAVFASDGMCPDNLAWLMGWFAGMMNQQSFLAQHRLDSEKSVVLNEGGISADKDEETLDDELLYTMFRWHNDDNMVSGAHNNAERLAAFYRLYYRPDNASLIVSGQIDAATLLQWIAEHFGPVQRPATALPAPVIVMAQQQGEREVTLRRVGAAPVVEVGYRGPAFVHPDMAAFLLLCKILDTRLKTRQAALRPIVIDSSIWAFHAADANILQCSLTPRSIAELPQARAAMLELFEAGDRLTQAELDAARQAVTQSDNAVEKDHKIIILGVQCGDWRLTYWLEQRCLQLTLDELQAKADVLLQPANRTLAVLLPVDQAPAAWPQAPALDLDVELANYSVRPQSVAPASRLTFNAIVAGTQGFTLDNGVQVAWFARPDGSTTGAFLRLSLSDAQSGHQYLLAYVLHKLIELSSFEGYVHAKAGFMQLDIAMYPRSLGMLERDIEALCRVLGRSTRLSAEECRHLLNGLGDYEGGALFPYPAGNPRYHPSESEWETAIRKADPLTLQQLLQAALSTCRVTLGACGDIDQSQLWKALRDGSGDWPAAQPFQPFAPDVPQRSAQRKETRLPGKKNAQMTVYLFVPTFSHVDYPMLKMARHLLDERMFIRIREQMGLSYSMGSAFGPPTPGAHFLEWTFAINFAPQNRARVEQGFDEELARARRDGFSVQELQDSQRYFANQRWYQAWKNQHVPIDSDTDAAEILAVGVEVDNDLRHYDRLAALTLDEVNAALRRYLDPAYMQRHFIGDFA